MLNAFNVENYIEQRHLEAASLQQNSTCQPSLFTNRHPNVGASLVSATSRSRLVQTTESMDAYRVHNVFRKNLDRL